MPVRSRLRRGFTLIEVMTAVVIVIILAALAVTYMVYGMGKARMNNAVFDFAAMVNAAQLRAISRGSPHYIFLHQTPDNRLRLLVLERPDDNTNPNWGGLSLNQPPEVELSFNHKKPDGTQELIPAYIRDQLVLGASTGGDGSGLAFLHLDSPRMPQNLPAPFNAISLNSTAPLPSNPNQPTQDLLAGCNFCISPAGHPYGVLKFNADGTMDVMTGNAQSGAAIAFAPNTGDEKGITPKILTVSAPAGAAVVF